METAPQRRRRQDQGIALFNLGFLEFNVLADDRVVLASCQLVGHRTAVLFRDIEKASIGRRQKLNLDGRGLRHGIRPYLLVIIIYPQGFNRAWKIRCVRHSDHG